MIDTKWDNRFMRLAKEIASWSKDPSSKIGAVIVNSDRRILATGYNGFPKGIQDTEERLNDREEKYPRIVHAEMNALMNALYSGISLRDSIIYVYGLPVCPECTKAIISSGIKRIVMSPDPYVHITTWSDKWNSISLPMIKEVGDIAITYSNPE